MKLSDETVSILKNFASINTGIVLRPGKTIKTIAADKSILAEAEVQEEFPVEFGIYDLNQFLGNVTTMKSPELIFESKSVTIRDSMFDLKYRFCPSELIVTPPQDKKLSLSNPDVSFDLTTDQMAKMLKLAAMNSLPHITIKGEDGKLKLIAHEKGNDGKHNVEAILGDWNGEIELTATFKTELLKLMPQDYLVEIKLGMFARFTSKSNQKLTYFISLETK